MGTCQRSQARPSKGSQIQPLEGSQHQPSEGSQVHFSEAGKVRLLMGASVFLLSLARPLMLTRMSNPGLNIHWNGKLMKTPSASRFRKGGIEPTIFCNSRGSDVGDWSNTLLDITASLVQKACL